MKDANATCRNNVGRNMLRVFGHHVATCWEGLDGGVQMSVVS